MDACSSEVKTNHHNACLTNAMHRIYRQPWICRYAYGSATLLCIRVEVMSCNLFVVCHTLPTANDTNLQVQS